MVISTSNHLCCRGACALRGQAVIRPQGFGNTPGLSEAAPGTVRRIAVHDLADAADTAFFQVTRETCEQCQRVLRIPVHAMVGQRKGAEEPAPYGSLVIGAVTGARIARIARGIA